ncbi:hypothetical protein [Streptomyces cavernicola]|uniref:NfeD-like C-terminal domain-containing protein n=1 Tax=Streptomyces cavernicola TaxID=3043613 RepID=A0ABT6S8G3_9ACTN|nr:hypothetical protein [Streptomyces sp. B-S-A6]MDI3403718.1 hypothetical protein [Streptomyces sp. B-S-A6]
MTLFLGLGMAGVVLLALSLVLDGLLEGLLGGAVDGLLDGWLSLPVVAGFLSMLGFGGALTLGTTGLGTVAATAVGTGAGLVTAYGVWRASRALLRDSTESPRGDDLVGSAGRVVTAIPSEGYGEVLLQLAGQPVKLAAKCAEPVTRGTEVWVERTLSATSVAVRPVER